MFLQLRPSRFVWPKSPKRDLWWHRTEEVVSWVQENDVQDAYNSHVVHIRILRKVSSINYRKVKESQVLLFGDYASSVQGAKLCVVQPQFFKWWIHSVFWPWHKNMQVVVKIVLFINNWTAHQIDESDLPDGIYLLFLWTKIDKHKAAQLQGNDCSAQGWVQVNYVNLLA